MIAILKKCSFKGYIAYLNIQRKVFAIITERN